jgi:hypothetical protein
MAIVKTQKKQLWGKEFIQKVKCSAAGQFSCDLPGVVADALDQKEVIGTSLVDVEKLFDKKIAEYNNSEKQEDKFIILNQSLNAWITAGDVGHDAEDQDEILFKESFHSGRHGVNINYNFDIVQRTICNGHTTYKSLRNNDYINTYQIEDNLLPWTQEREEFFISIETALKNILLKLHEFEKTPILEMAQKIDSGVKLLGNNK